MTNITTLQERVFGPTDDSVCALPTAPRPVCIRRNRRSVGHHDPVEMVAGFVDTIEIMDVAILICPICGVRRETSIEAACEHDWLCDGSTVLVL